VGYRNDRTFRRERCLIAARAVGAFMGFSIFGFFRRTSSKICRITESRPQPHNNQRYEAHRAEENLIQKFKINVGEIKTERYRLSCGS